MKLNISLIQALFTGFQFSQVFHLEQTLFSNIIHNSEVSEYEYIEQKHVLYFKMYTHTMLLCLLSDGNQIKHRIRMNSSPVSDNNPTVTEKTIIFN